MALCEVIREKCKLLSGLGRLPRTCLRPITPLARWFKLPAVQQEQGRARQEAQAEHPLSIRATMEAQLLACRRDGSPDWTARAQAARILAELPPEAAHDDPQLFAIRITADGEQHEVCTVPPGFRSPAAVTLVVDAQ
jgi:hypothetical protein